MAEISVCSGSYVMVIQFAALSVIKEVDG